MTDARLLRSIRAATDVMRRAAIDLCLERAMDRFQRLLREHALERRYNPDWRLQPRVPRGDPDGGQWTHGPGGVGRESDRTVPSDTVTRDGRRPARRLAPAKPAAREPVGLTDPRVMSDANPDNEWELGEQYAQVRPPPRGAAQGAAARTESGESGSRPPRQKRLDTSSHWHSGISQWRGFGNCSLGGSQLRDCTHPRSSVKTRHNEAITKEAIVRYQQLQRSLWHPDIIDLLSRAAEPTPEPIVPPERPLTTRDANVVVKGLSRWLSDPATFEAVDVVIGAGSWLFDFRYYITAYLEPPKTMEELRAAANNPQPGHDNHHLVEKSSAREDDFPESWIEGNDNRLGIPTLKHWQVTGWFMTPNRRLGWQTPREYLRGRTWAEREELGKEALRYFGVLKK